MNTNPSVLRVEPRLAAVPFEEAQPEVTDRGATPRGVAPQNVRCVRWRCLICYL